MALYIKANSLQGEEIKPKNGKTFTLEEMQKAVGGYIEILHLADGRIMVLNEEGKLNGLETNITATGILAEVGSYVFGRHLKHADVIYAFGGNLVGDVLVCDDTEIL